MKKIPKRRKSKKSLYPNKKHKAPKDEFSKETKKGVQEAPLGKRW